MSARRSSPHARRPGSPAAARLADVPAVERAMLVRWLEDLHEHLGSHSELASWVDDFEKKADEADEADRALVVAVRAAALGDRPWPAGGDAGAIGAEIDAFLAAAAEVRALCRARNDMLFFTVAKTCGMAEDARLAPTWECDSCGHDFDPTAFLALRPLGRGEHDVNGRYDVRRCDREGCAADEGAIVFLPLPGAP